MDLAAVRTTWSPRFLSLLRIMAAAMFVLHGADKLFGFLADGPPKELPILMKVAGSLEFFGGLLLLIGLFTRPTAFVLSGLMAVAYFMAHAPKGFWPTKNHGEVAVLYCFIYLYLSAAGGGSWSVDRQLGRD